MDRWRVLLASTVGLSPLFWLAVDRWVGIGPGLGYAIAIVLVALAVGYGEGDRRTLTHRTLGTWAIVTVTAFVALLLFFTAISSGPWSTHDSPWHFVGGILLLFGWTAAVTAPVIVAGAILAFVYRSIKDRHPEWLPWNQTQDRQSS